MTENEKGQLDSEQDPVEDPMEEPKKRYYTPGEVRKKHGCIGCGGMVLATTLALTVGLGSLLWAVLGL